jgi:phosphatidate cytidylyltransferase
LLATRTITALVLGAIVTYTVFFLPTPLVATVLGAVWLGGAWEWAGFARWEAPARAAYVALLAAAMLSAPYWALGPPGIETVLAVAILWWALALLTILMYPRRIPPGAVAVAGFLALVPAWLVLVYLHGQTGGSLLAFSVLAVVWAADVGAYVVGRWLGRVKLAPKVSPGKTWEGVIGGTALAALTGWGMATLTGFPAPVFVGVAVATALGSVVGDLTVSVFKRNVGLKDSGRLLPGHGGIMDRIDSLTAALPIFTLGIEIAGLAG